MIMIFLRLGSLGDGFRVDEPRLCTYLTLSAELINGNGLGEITSTGESQISELGLGTFGSKILHRIT